MSVNRIQITQGGLYGSEAKGAIAAYLAVRDNIDYCVRTGATNAGHTAYYGATPVVLQQLPVGFVNKNARLVLGAGALIDLDILQRECEKISALTGHDVRERLSIDYRAFIHRAVHRDRSTSAGRHRLIGATGKGCSEALIDRVRLRGVENWTVSEQRKTDERLSGFKICDTELLLNNAYDAGAKIQLEGTQGQLLDLYLGPYPYTTHKQTGPAQWMLECGLSPSLPTDIVMVVRTYPIRVAGNSGPMPEEISWPILAREINANSPIVKEAAIAAFEEAVRKAAHKYMVPPGSDGLDQHLWSPSDRLHCRTALSDLNQTAIDSLDAATVAELRKLFEITTVTKKLRRVARLDMKELARSARQMRPDRVAVTFMNYEFPGRWATSDTVNDKERAYLALIGTATRSVVTLINRGPAPVHTVEV